jgi:hypothetical protein
MTQPTTPRQPATHRANYKDNFEEIYLRHSKFRRSQNPPDHLLKQAITIIKQTASKAYYQNRFVLAPMGFSKDDLVNIGLVHAISFLADKDIATNKGLFVNYLKQRYWELANTSKKKLAVTQTDVTSESVLDFESFLESYATPTPDYEIPIQSVEYLVNETKHTITIKPIGLLEYGFWLDNQPITKDIAETIMSNINNGTYPIVPQKTDLGHRESLTEALNTLDPAKREHLLLEAAQNQHIPIEAQTVAKRLCNTLVCPNCNKKIMSGLKCLGCGCNGQPQYTNATPQRQAHDLTKQQISQLVKKLKTECFNKLPDLLTCSKCHQQHPKANFGVRVAKNKQTGLPYRASKQSYCRDCRKLKSA